MAGQVNRNDMRCTAFHEAGHAVAIALNELPFERVYVVHREDETKEYTEGPLGTVVRNLHIPSFAGKLSEAMKEIEVCYAGPIAETFAYPNLLPLLSQEAPDVKDAISIAKYALVDFEVIDSQAHFDRDDFKAKWERILEMLVACERNAYALVQRQEKAIARIAERLLVNGELAAAEVREVVRAT